MWGAEQRSKFTEEEIQDAVKKHGPIVAGGMAQQNEAEFSDHPVCAMVAFPYRKYRGTVRNCCNGGEQMLELIEYSNTPQQQCYTPHDWTEVEHMNNGQGCKAWGPDGNVWTHEEPPVGYNTAAAMQDLAACVDQ